MKHFSGQRGPRSSNAARPAPSDTLRDSKPLLQSSKRANIARNVNSDVIRYDLAMNTAAGHQRVVRTAAAPEQYLDEAPTSRPAAAQPPPPPAARPAAPHSATRAKQQRSRQLVRVASHSIDVASDLSSSSESEQEVSQQHGSGLRQRKYNGQQGNSGTSAAATSTPSSSKQQRNQRVHRAPTTAAPAAATATAGGAAPTSTGKPHQQQQERRSRSRTTYAFSAIVCLVLLVASGSTLRAVSSWRRATNTANPSLAAADTVAAAEGLGAAEGFTGSSWLSSVPSYSFWSHSGRSASTPAAATSAAAAGAAARGMAGTPASQWLPVSATGFTSSLKSAAQQVLSYTAMSRAAVGRGTASYATPGAHSSSSSSSGGRHPGVTRAASTGAAATVPPGGSSISSGSGGSKASTAGSIKLYAVVDGSAPSPFVSHSPKGSKGLDWTADWGDVVQHMAQRLEWTDERFNLQVITQDELKFNPAARQALSAALSTPNPTAISSSGNTPMFVGIGITDPEVAAFLTQATAQLPTVLFWNSDPGLSASSRVDGYAPASAGPFAKLMAQNVGFSREAKAAEVMKTLEVLWGRNTSDDLLYIWLVLLNQYVTPVPMVANTTKGTDLASLYCMIKNCGQKIVDCVTDKTCKAGLDCLEGCAFNDQVCQYRCIVSYETPQFEQFALCILQLHNCRGLNAEIPMRPDPAPMTQWRGQALTHETAEDLFIGWLSKGPQLPDGGEARLKPYSWLVAAGKNPAYDAFGCQHQLYYRGKGKGQMWYEPVFRVTTLEGKEVWRDRRYRVRRGETPGTFYYSVLDNGVTSNEYWRIIDCAEDLTYCLFYYSGAAAAAGMSYTGAVLGTRDGLWPTAYTERIHEALRQAGIEPWELSMPDNSRCADAPLKPVAT